MNLNTRKNLNEFYHERFGDNAIDFKGHNFEPYHLGPVGSRMCLGMIMRSTTVMVTLQTFYTVLIGKCQMGLRGKISTW